MDRRQFLALGGVSLLPAGLTGCGGGDSSSAPPPPPPPPGPDWEALRAQLQGDVLLPADDDFARVRLVANARYDTVSPMAVARCASAGDVAAALGFAQQQKLAFTARSGGHSYLGASGGTGLVIDVGPMDNVQLAGELATVGAGAQLTDVYDALISAGRCIPSGSCVSVGIAGITLGGGVGVVDRAHGLSCDALVSARVVTADGRQLDCSATQHADLFWALRGGGGGQVGIVTSLTFQTHAVTGLTQFGAVFPLSDLPAVLATWQAWPATLPDAIWSQLVLSGMGVYVWGIGIGDEPVVKPHWDGLLARIGRTPDATELVPRTYRDVMLGACASLSVAQCHLPSQDSAGVLRRAAMAASSDYFGEPLDRAGIDALAQAVQQRRDSGLSGVVLLNLMGGAAGRVAIDATAFPHRAALFSAQYLAEYAPGTAASTLDEAATWTHGMRATMQPWSTGLAYVNYLDALLENPAQAYFGTNLTRLRQIKRLYDPQNVFKAVPALG